MTAKYLLASIGQLLNMLDGTSTCADRSAVVGELRRRWRYENAMGRPEGDRIARALHAAGFSVFADDVWGVSS